MTQQQFIDKENKSLDEQVTEILIRNYSKTQLLNVDRTIRNIHKLLGRTALRAVSYQTLCEAVAYAVKLTTTSTKEVQDELED